MQKQSRFKQMHISDRVAKEISNERVYTLRSSESQLVMLLVTHHKPSKCHSLSGIDASYQTIEEKERETNHE
jgi:hypothetical protein